MVVVAKVACQPPAACVIPKELAKTAALVDAIGRAIFPRGYVKDTTAWIEDGDWRIAWIMPATKLQKLIGAEDYHLPLNASMVDYWVSRILGKKESNFRYERELVAGDFLPRLTDDVRGSLEEETDLRITFIPEPGYPWPCDNDVYLSVAKKKLIKSSRPPWLIERIVDASRSIDSPGVDLCQIFETETVRPMNTVVGRYGDRPDDVFMVTHAMSSLTGQTRFGDWEKNAEAVNNCGGLLFPSMAVGPIPAANFGLAVLIADVGLVLNSLKPYRRRAERAVVGVYDTDAWTGTTRDFLLNGAISAYEQLHGHSVYTYDLHVWPLGAPTAPELNGPAEASTLDTTKQLIAELKRRFKIWRRGLTPEKYETIAADHALAKARYGYLEAKVNAVMPMRDFPLAVVPRELESGFSKFLAATGFVGELLTVDLPAEVREVMDENWSPPDMLWERREAIRTWAWTEYGWNVLDRVMAYDGPSGREVVLHRERRSFP